MHKLRISIILDIILTSGILFVLFFCWFRFYSNNLVLSIFISLLITFLIVFILFFYKHKKDNKKSITAKQRKLALDCATQFRFSTPKEVRKFFYDIIKDKYKIENKPNGLIVTFENKRLMFVPSFEKEIFTSNDLATYYSYAKKYNTKQLTICSSEFDDNSKNLAKAIKTLPITLLDIYETFSQIIEPSQKLPETVIDTQSAKLTFKQILSYAVSRDRTKNYTLFGIILIFSSFFVMFKIYYLVFGSVLLAMAILTRVLPHKQKTQISSIHL